MLFCESNQSWSVIWIDQGFSKCFLLPLITCVPAFVAIFGGIIEIFLYRKYANRKPDFQVRWLLTVLIILHIILIFQPVFLLGVQEFYIQQDGLHGYEILVATVTGISWVIILTVLWLECRFQLPSIPSHSHGIVLLVFWALALLGQLLPLTCWLSKNWWFPTAIRNGKSNVELAMWIVRLISSLMVFLIGYSAPGMNHYTRYTEGAEQDDTEALIGGGSTQRSTWKNVWKKLKLLWPFMWPKSNFLLQLCVLASMLILVAGRVVNLFTPLYYKYIVDSLTPKNMTTENQIHTASGLAFRWDLILIYVALRFLQGGGAGGLGFLNNFRSFLWIWVQQYTDREMQTKLFAHLHGLSLRWHLSRKTGEVLRVMDRGTSSINSLLNYIVFNILPTIADIVIAIVYFLTAFDAWFAFIVFVTMVLYLGGTIMVTEWRTKYRRDMNLLDNQKNAQSVDSLLNFETVKYYGAEDFEVQMYRKSILDYQSAEWKSSASLNLLNSFQNIVINGGLLLGSLLCVWYVVDNKGLTAGDYVLFSTYVIQLYGPLNWFGTYYRMIQQSFVDMENMFDLLKEKQEVMDAPAAPDLAITQGQIEFKNVNFHYQPERPVLHDVAFTVPPGNTFALVGPSGAGKSTIVRLLFRFYDPLRGAIIIDGQDIAKVTQKSLRQAIGVVPQDTVLFNKNIKYNIRYGRVTASDVEVEAAAVAADIHARILTFPDTYDTVVGERGLKLSGGEKQRVAIARTILKAPQIVLLDEATSALDTQTERNIQYSLAKICQGRTTLIVAHRLSTITHSDQILVLKDGDIVERGTHTELLDQKGLYSSMWVQQSKVHSKKKKKKKEGSSSSGSSAESDGQSLDGML